MYTGLSNPRKLDQAAWGSFSFGLGRLHKEPSSGQFPANQFEIKA
jgi:hypothetical protein